MSDYSKYDIQGQIVPKTSQTPFEESKEKENRNLTELQDDGPIGTGSDTIPTSPPGIDTPDLLTTTKHASNTIVDPLKMAIDANAQGLKNMGMITESQADANAARAPEKVLNVTGTIA